MKPAQEYTQAEINALGKKYNRIIGTTFLAVAALVVCINLLCRHAGNLKAARYEYVEGTVTKAYERKSYPNGVKHPHYDYTIWVEYEPCGARRTYKLIDSSHSYEFIRVGDALRVYYLEEDPYEAYAAKKDWLTGAYLPAENSYNIPLIISAVLVVIGIYFFVDNDKKSI